MASENFKRIISFGINNFKRNNGISLASVFVLVVMLMLISGLFFFHGFANHLKAEIQDKIDITAYFKDEVPEQDILNVKDEIIKLSPTIKGVEYVSKDEALANFKERHGDNPVLADALSEVGENPFLPSLNITTNGDPAQFQQIATILQNSDFSTSLDRVDFSEKKDTIEKVYAITSRVNRIGIGLSALLLLIGLLVVFNTIKLAIDHSEEEISTMRIVGASDWFIRGPFIICGAIYGLVAFAISFFLCAVISYFLSSYLAVLLPGFSLFRYLLSNFLIFVLIQLGFGVGVGVLSSLIVVRKYLKI